MVREEVADITYSGHTVRKISLDEEVQ